MFVLFILGQLFEKNGETRFLICMSEVVAGLIEALNCRRCDPCFCHGGSF